MRARLWRRAWGSPSAAAGGQSAYTAKLINQSRRQWSAKEREDGKNNTNGEVEEPNVKGSPLCVKGKQV